MRKVKVKLKTEHTKTINWDPTESLTGMMG